MINDRPAVSVTIPARDRVAHLRRAVASVLAISDPGLELNVADQSAGEESARFLQSVAAIGVRVVPLRLTSTGKARGVNEALRRARAEIIAFTSDDCTVPADWLRCHLATLARERDVGIVFGRVDAAPHDPMEARSSSMRWATGGPSVSSGSSTRSLAVSPPSPITASGSTC